jgi:hypothetical protein
MVGKGNKTLGFIRRNLKDCTKPVKSAAYTAIVRPTVEYASTIWDLSNKKKKIKSIEQVQKRAARFVHNNYTDRTPGCVTNMVKSLKWENLEDRRKSARLSMLFNIQHDFIDIDRQQYLTPNTDTLKDARQKIVMDIWGSRKNIKFECGLPLPIHDLVCDHGYLPLVVSTSWSFPHSRLITGFITRLTRWVPLEQELLTLPEHLSSPTVFSGVPVTRSLVLYVCFVDRCLSFCTFSFGHCVVCFFSIYGF